MNAVKEMAYAKINLYLDVTAKRPDGFHEIKTVMHTVSLADEITVSSEEKRGASQVRLTVVGADFLPTDGRNLTVKAAELFLSRSGVSASVNIKLKKKIPVAAGLAGGSSDAAAVLRALNRIFGKPFTEKAMLSMAAELGSDVPYCFVGGTALCSGRGEIMTRIHTDYKGVFLIVKIPEHVSTPAAYSALDKLYSDFDAPHEAGGSLDGLTEGIKSGILKDNAMYNIFESAVFPIVPASERVKARLSELGARASLMSGSGPTVFGVFENEERAEAAKSALSLEGYTVFLAKTV